ncbi:MAG: hypothetical protein AAGF97_00460 [Planctomycetota bacterium]
MKTRWQRRSATHVTYRSTKFIAKSPSLCLCEYVTLDPAGGVLPAAVLRVWLIWDKDRETDVHVLVGDVR